MGAGSTREEPLPPDAEARLASFTELVATAIANADSRAKLMASRARIVAAADETRRRIERDLHDGTQQRLVSLGLAARTAAADVAAGRGDPGAELSRIAAGLADAAAELQEFSRGIHPAILSERGLGPALRTLARRSAILVDLEITTDARCPEPVEIAAYYVASEALANAMKHAQASRVEMSLATRRGSLLLSVRDDGIGGADPARGSGLAGLTDRVEAWAARSACTARPGPGRTSQWIVHSSTSRPRVPVDGPAADSSVRVQPGVPTLLTGTLDPLLTGRRIGRQPGRNKGPHAPSWNSREPRVTHERCRNLTQTEGPHDDGHGS
jgi:signal transduction histidine kinase